jgi:hypothetical protein
MPLTVSQPSDSSGREPLNSDMGSGRCNGLGGGGVLAIVEPVVFGQVIDSDLRRSVREGGQ